MQSIRKTAFVTVKFMIKYYYIVVLFSVCPTVCRDGSMIRFCTQKGEKRMKKPDENFIMLPTVDFCFKELMMNPKVRTGFIAALLDLSPDEIQDTEIVPTELPRDYSRRKTGEFWTSMSECGTGGT